MTIPIRVIQRFFPVDLNVSGKLCEDDHNYFLQTHDMVKGQILNKQIIDIMSCPLHKPNTNGRISFKLEWHIHLN